MLLWLTVVVVVVEARTALLLQIAVRFRSQVLEHLIRQPINKIRVISLLFTVIHPRPLLLFSLLFFVLVCLFVCLFVCFFVCFFVSLFLCFFLSFFVLSFCLFVLMFVSKFCNESLGNESFVHSHITVNEPKDTDG